MSSAKPRPLLGCFAGFVMIRRSGLLNKWVPTPTVNNIGQMHQPMNVDNEIDAPPTTVNRTENTLLNALRGSWGRLGP